MKSDNIVVPKSISITNRIMFSINDAIRKLRLLLGVFDENINIKKVIILTIGIAIKIISTIHSKIETSLSIISPLTQKII